MRDEPEVAHPVPVSVDTASHYTWGDSCDGWHLVRAETLSVIQERMPTGTSEQRHRHQHARQFFYVLSGRLEMEVEGTRHVLRDGMGLEIAPRLAHVAWNESGDEVNFMVVSQPPAHGDREAAPAAGDE